MNLRFRDSPRTGATPLKSGIVLAGILCTCLVLVFLGCGGDDSHSSPGTAAASATTSTTAQASEMSPDELGDAIAATWSEAIQELVALLEGQPEPSAVRSQVEDLKETYITELVALGHLREAFSDSEKAQVEARVQTELAKTADEPWFVSYTDIYNAYPEDDLEFKNLLASFNILTQYAFFDLLKQQEPEEAARLGID
nr:hypothetical protein [uncultured bacterium]